MKKPDIAQGEWYLRELSSNDFNLETREFIIARHIEKRHAKALKAVPDMIEALKDAKKAIKSLSKEDLGKARTDKYEWYVRDELLDKIENVLKKAGANLNEKVE